MHLAGQAVQHSVVPSAKADIFRQRQHGYAGVAKISFRQLLAAAVGAGVPRRKPTPWLLLARQLAPKFDGIFKKADDHYTMQDEDLTVPRRIEFCTGSFMAVRTDVFKEIGGFDPAYFMYVEDADLTQKVLQKGTVWLAPQFSAIHAWHRAPMRDAGKFKMQLVSMGRYFKKWGCGKGKV